MTKEEYVKRFADQMMKRLDNWEPERARLTGLAAAESYYEDDSGNSPEDDCDEELSNWTD